MRILKKNQTNPKGLLTVAELRDAEYDVIRRIQQETFPEDWKRLVEGKEAHRCSPLRWFVPRIPSENLIRVGGRLEKSEESEDTKHPKVLPAKHPFTIMLYEHYHQKLMHAGSQLLISSVRLKYWHLEVGMFLGRLYTTVNSVSAPSLVLSSSSWVNYRWLVSRDPDLFPRPKWTTSDQYIQHQEKVSRECVNNQIQWHFIPPAAHHFGGLWEASVRSAKKHLLKVFGENAVPFEDFTTFLVQVENCLNSRPITALTDDPSNLQPLTPGHFLVGEALQQLPERDYKEVPMNRLNQSQVLQKKLEHFWDRWRVEYFTQQQGR
ncbi:uncharacterized protein LOC129743355 [Uranotaenia lowii]|uniref:uncharacterized protein LOC129743355 n=1 Tax=Uranotaenia lowii TaxID=190385 RepID=UPI0024796E2E|nr:uncharacterized protein LOC129743355 [Uranotaenia lowii]